jgi:predicted transposase/invertase (TIGR01784 family)
LRINRKNDYAFKRIFGHEDTKDILADFLTAVLATSITPEEIVLVNTEISPAHIDDKSSILDIQVRRGANHEKMNIEMQRADEGNIERRILFYWGRSYTSELKEGDDYANLPRQINIVITDFDVFEWLDATKFHGVFRVTERDEGVIFSDALEIHLLELPKLRRQPMKENWADDECWGLYLDNLEGSAMESIAEKNPLIRRAMTVEDVFAQNERERILYEQREKGRRDYLNAMNTAERRGMEKGMEKGMAKGMAKGEERGRAAGLAESKLAIARSMLADSSLSPEMISKFTGLPVEEINLLH